MQDRATQILSIINKNPHYKGSKCEHPECSSELFAIGVIHTSYLFIVDKNYNISDPTTGVWENCEKCKKQFFTCNLKCYKELNKKCFDCQRCKIRKCKRRATIRCVECFKNVCPGHLLRCMNCDKRVCSDRKCRAPKELYCLGCWCPVCDNLCQKSCWCPTCQSLHGDCNCKT